MKWIPCEERLPNDNREVLISLEWGIDIGTYERGEWRSEWINHYDDDNVLAWMPLPQPYTAGCKIEPNVVMPKKCKGCDSTSKIIEAYSRGFEDGAEAVKAVQTDRE